MKQIYNIILTALTIAMLLLLTFAKLNEFGNWVDLTKYQDVINIVSSYGPIVLVCLFAFGSLFGRVLSKVFFVIILLLLIVFTVSMFFPEWVGSLFKKASNPDESTIFITMLKHIM